MFDQLYNVDDVEADVGGRAKMLLPKFIGHKYRSFFLVVKMLILTIIAL
jgi:hypothetical protein